MTMIRNMSVIMNIGMLSSSSPLDSQPIEGTRSAVGFCESVSSVGISCMTSVSIPSGSRSAALCGSRNKHFNDLD